MNPKTISVVISREYSTRVKKKSFLVTTFIVPLLFAALCCIPVLIMRFNKDETKLFAVVDRSGIVMQNLEQTSEVQFADCSNVELDSLKKNFADMPYSAILYISPIDENKSVAVCTYSVKPVGVSIQENIERRVESAVQDYRIEGYDIADLKNILEEVKPDINIKSFTISEDGEDKVSDVGVYMALSMILGIIIFMFVTMFSSSVMQSVIEEKQSKVVEVLLSSIDSLDLMFGKIIGVALVALTQFLAWIILTMVIVSAVFGAVGRETLLGSAQQMTEVAGTAGMDASVPAVQMSTAQEIFTTLTNIDFPLLLGSFFVFFIFGYLLYASMFAAVGSAVENAEDSSQLQIPLTVPLMIAYFIAIYAWKAPDSALSVWGSMIPFTSPIVMLTRIPFGVPSWQIWLSFAILVVTFVLMAWLSAKIYRVGILTSGKKASWKDLWKWIRQN